MTESTQTDRVPPEPVRVKATTTLALCATAFITGGLAVAATYGGYHKHLAEIYANSAKEAWEVVEDATEFIDRKNLAAEYLNATKFYQRVKYHF